MEESDTYPRKSADFLNQFALLASRLVELGIVTVDVRLSYGFGGSWTFVVHKRFEELRGEFDGRDQFLDISVSPIDHATFARNWTTIVQRPIEPSMAMTILEEVIRKRYPLGPKPPGAK